jgi:hypothetical protein
VLITLLACATPSSAQVPQKSPQPATPATTPPAAAANRQAGPTRANILRGENGRYRANNDLLFYHLDVQVEPEQKFLKGKTSIRFKMLKDDSRIQLDLHDALKVDKILLTSPKSKVQSPKSETRKLTLISNIGR